MMTDERSTTSQLRGISALALVTLVVLIGGVVYWISQPGNVQPGQDNRTKSLAESGRAIEQFYVGVSALEVEENQRAASIFEELSEILPNEPVVWANLTVARLRLNELQTANESVRRAAELAPSSDSIVILQALVNERSGDLKQAIELLGSVREPDAATSYQLAELLSRTGLAEDDEQRLALYGKILSQLPDNLVVLFERGRLAARLEEEAVLKETLKTISSYRDSWTESIRDRYEFVSDAVEKKDFRRAATEMTFLQNLSKPESDYQNSLTELGLSSRSVGSPFREFLSLEQEPTLVAESDLGLHFEIDTDSKRAVRPDMFLAFPSSGERDSTLLSLTGDELQIGTTAVLRFSHPLQTTAPSSLGLRIVQSVDVNSDFQEDIVCVGDQGLSIVLQLNKTEFKQFEPIAEQQSLFESAGNAVWALDYEADGDLDLLISTSEEFPRLLQNNGDMTFSEISSFPKVGSLRDVLWMDLDRDGDGDIITLAETGALSVLWNQRGGKYSSPEEIRIEGSAVAITAGDPDQDGTFDLVVLNEAGSILRLFIGNQSQEWTSHELLKWSDTPDLQDAFRKKQVSVYLADLDNNGGMDVTASAGRSTAVWLNDLRQPLQRLGELPELFVTAVTDYNGDGRLDLVGMTDEAGVIAINRGEKDYHWQTILARANPNPGDSRINTFGIGGRIGLRAGRLQQSAPITTGRTHFGLGEHSRAGLARIVWPNGTVQAEFELSANQYITAQQRLKGSCPFVFARRGDELVFVKDFIWRSPLGLKINSQETAGVSQTEDRIKIPGELLTPIEGCYEIRITADLWETHFFDHLSLQIVDHRDSNEMYVDERFMPATQPELSPQLVSRPRPVLSARDEQGRDVQAMIRATDAICLDTFSLGKFQGIAEDHWVEFELGEEVLRDGGLLLVGEGWIYPTDSSLNVAMSQGSFPQPNGLVLEMPDEKGVWKPVTGDLGFPAGKHKTVLLPIPKKALKNGQKRFRLRTNLEVYWDFLGWAVARPNEEIRAQPVNLLTADLRYRGFSELSSPHRRHPDVPRYEKLCQRGQRWQDLEGFYTRYGDVRELLQTVDDRYVIMNAGDEMVLKFSAPADPPEGWKRDFVLIGDGWVKDGDYNTSFSKTVHPLPSHAFSEPSSGFRLLCDDPVYQIHQEDWQTFHTRFVSPHDFHHVLDPASRDQRF